VSRRNQETNRRENSVVKGAAAGVIGGIVASWVMEEFQSTWTKLSEQSKKTQDNSYSSERSTDNQVRNGEMQATTAGGQNQVSGNKEQEPATVKVAEAISEKLLDHRLTEKEKESAGEAVHYAMGAASGALYGAAAELIPFASAGAGLPFGAAVWLVLDEVTVPALGLSKPPAEYPISTHVYALASHFVYGFTTDMVRRALRKTVLH
jgi:putative membrane protein